VKLTTHLHLSPRSRMVELYLHSLTCLHGAVLNRLSKGETLPFLPFPLTGRSQIQNSVRRPAIVTEVLKCLHQTFRKILGLCFKNKPIPISLMYFPIQFSILILTTTRHLNLNIPNYCRIQCHTTHAVDQVNKQETIIHHHMQRCGCSIN
jgi:hypothetical protein